MSHEHDEAIETYQTAVLAVHVAAKMLAQHDLPRLLADIAKANAIGPLLDPTLWRDKNRAMLEDREALQAALPLYRLGKKLEEVRGG